MVNVAVMEGWAGGPRLSRRFLDAVRAAGYNLTDTAHADVIIAHSTACYLIPNKTPAKLLILIDPPYWPGKSIVSRVLAKKRSDSQSVRQAGGWKPWLAKTGWEAMYVLTKPGYTTAALKHNGSLDFLSGLKHISTYVVRNEKDDFCSADIQVALNGHSHVRYVPLPGEHDDYYVNPQPYIALLPKSI
jgi:hypothetical protein